jgi:hypothetical protein
MLALALVACAPPEGQPVDTDPPTTLTTPTTDTAASDTDVPTTGPTATTPTVDCDALPSQAPFSTIDIATQEDFDFDGYGYLIHQNGSNMAGMSYYHDLRIITPGIGDTAGIQIISNGDIIYASPFTGSIRHIFIDTGADFLLAGGLTFPDGLEIGANDRVYYSERSGDGRVRYIDVFSQEAGTVLENVNVPNGLALSPDEKTLYIAGGFGAGLEGIIAVDQDETGAWGAPRSIIQATAASFDGVEVDECGNVYAVGWSDGKVFRTKPDGSEQVMLADLTAGGGPAWGLYNSIRWGSGYGGWRRDVLYVTDRSQIYAVEVGVKGRASPVAAP